MSRFAHDTLENKKIYNYKLRYIIVLSDGYSKDLKFCLKQLLGRINHRLKFFSHCQTALIVAPYTSLL